MSVYYPLRDYLLAQKDREFELSFREIENILGGTLPAGAKRPQWWAYTVYAGEGCRLRRSERL